MPYASLGVVLVAVPVGGAVCIGLFCENKTYPQIPAMTTTRIITKTIHLDLIKE
jgi:hypothetical protein